MRKHPLIAVTAFTALGLSAIAGARTGAPDLMSSSGPSGAPAAFALASGAAPSAAATPAPTPQPLTVSPPHVRGRDEVVVHDAIHRTSVLFVYARQTAEPHNADHHHGAAARSRVTSSPARTRAVAAAPTIFAAPPETTTTTLPPGATAGTGQPPAGGVWYELRMCESGDNYAENSGNGYYGAYQFALATWYGIGLSGLPSDAPPALQD
ncbi:MAG: transglycosylase family protein, partial [Acidimicrobiales bacterium]